MLDYAASFVVYILEMLISYVFFTGIAKRKRSTVLCIVVGLLLFCAGSAANLAFQNSVLLNITVFFVINFLYQLICFDCSIAQDCFYAIILDVLCTATEYIVVYPVSLFTKTAMDSYNENLSILIIETVISKSLYFISCILFVRLKKNNTGGVKIPWSFFIFPAAVLTSCVILWYFNAEYQLTDSRGLPLAAIACILLLSIILLYITYQRNSEKEHELISLQNEHNRQKRDEQYYSLLRHQNEQLMVYAHDVKKHLRAIAELSDDPEISRYIQAMYTELNDYSRTLHTGNKMLDIILSRYIYECEQNGIDFKYDLIESNLGFIDDRDLVSILGNLMDNAVNAAVNAEKPKIFLETKHKEMSDAIIITNSTPGEVIIKDRMPVSNPDGLHGYGLKSVIKTVKKYKGQISCAYNSDSSEFKIDIIMNNVKSKAVKKSSS